MKYFEIRPGIGIINYTYPGKKKPGWACNVTPAPHVSYISVHQTCQPANLLLISSTHPLIDMSYRSCYVIGFVCSYLVPVGVMVLGGVGD